MSAMYVGLVEEMLSRHRVRVHRWRRSMSGMAWLGPGPDGSLTRWVESPEPRGSMSCAVFLHEIGHHALGIGRFRPRCLEEFQAWRWSLATMREREIAITAHVERRVELSLRYAVAKAVRRGAKAIPVELASYLPAAETTG
jgi:hypothetical protein